MRKPNILMIVIDSLRADHVSCYGYPRATTPTLDCVASEGCRFTTAISAAPFSPASYATLLMNEYPHRHGVGGDGVRVWPDTWPRLPEKLREQGYTTFCLSNNSFVTRDLGSDKGFDIFVDRDEAWLHRGRETLYRRARGWLGDDRAKRLSNAMHCAPKGDTEKTLRRVAQLTRDLPEPFFGFVILMDPHTPYHRRHTAAVGNSHEVKQFFAYSNGRTMWAEQMAANGRLSAGRLELVQKLYDAEIRHADDCLGRFIDQFRRTPRYDRTMLALAADHGEAFGEHGVYGHGFCLNDCLTRVPLIVRHPDTFTPGTTCDGLVQFHDLHDTFVAAASGEDFEHDLRHAANDGWTGRDAAFSEFPRQSKTLAFMHARNPHFQPGVWAHDMAAIRTREWRYIAYDDGSSELYDLNQDPEETASVEALYPEVRNELAARLAAHRGDQPDLPPAPETQEVGEEVLERLRALGYIE